jgi:phenylpyruvate tautomerase PptA (4-oxalocrotonate tautomerase family)
MTLPISRSLQERPTATRLSRSRCSLGGRSLEAKKRLYRGVVEALGAHGVPPNDVMIVLHEPPLENWGVQGGEPASEGDLGFDLNV